MARSGLLQKQPTVPSLVAGLALPSRGTAAQLLRVRRLITEELSRMTTGTIKIKGFLVPKVEESSEF